MDTIGNRIRSRRLELGLSQEELAKKVGYTSRSTINKIENGTNDITQSKVYDLAIALDTTISYLMGWEERTSMTKQEMTLLDAFRHADDITKQMVIRILNI